MRLLYIRIKQTQRQLKDLKLYILFFILVLSLLLAISISSHKEATSSLYQLSFLLIICASIQVSRKDRVFIYQHIKSPNFELFTEYVFFTLPFTVGVFFSSHWYFFFGFLLLLSLVPWIPFNISGDRVKLKTISKLFGSAAFEYIAGFRRSFYYLIPLYGAAVVFSWFRIFPLIFLWAITVIVTSFYNECEPLNLLRERCKNPQRFLWFMFLMHSKYLIILYSPILVINAVFNKGFWLINVLFLFLQMSLLLLALTLKYSCYIPNENHEKNKIVLSIASLGAIVPYFLPVPLFGSALYFTKAVKNLNRFL